ncbi:HIPL1 protein-like [Macadamia integrifolia]|uniref:HIPL1 protein-like n=1 Tax=Macadamia integrifolia TaxID=60698 RepID=UPI001C4EBE1F|nr:HIPL1 protein-like [Macadamia integrifolia]
MGGVLTIILPFWLLLLVPDLNDSFPLCRDESAPVTINTTLSFCPYNGSVCCNSAHDRRLQKRFQSMNISDPTCASLVKSVLCATCDKFSADLFKIESGYRTVPVLCNSMASSNTSHSNNATENFCSEVWDACRNVSIFNSPFLPLSLGGSAVPVNSTSKLIDIWKSKSEFCNTYGGDTTDGSICFDGEPVSLTSTGTPSPPSGLCLERIGNGSYLDMAPHPDGSNRVFLADQQGRIWLATVPEDGSGETLGLDELNPFLDLTDEVYFNSEFGLLGIAFHPNFTENGRFFVSFNCDKVKWRRCAGTCACNSDLNCDPSKIGTDNGAQPCQYSSVISEFTVNGTTSQISLAAKANPTEVRRIFTMGLPYTTHHGGQIIFGPADGYLYYMMGDGGGTGDPYNFSQNKKSLLGKIVRFDVDNFPSATEMVELGLWGNYSIPKDNPFSRDNESLPEIWALGLSNPWRCSFDSDRPSYFICADVGLNTYEEVDIISKGGNYGWRVYEGPNLFYPQQSPGGNTSANSINSIFPVMGYYHSAVNGNSGSASITGGYFYRGMTDPCMYGRYLYADLFAQAIWAGTESPQNSGNFTSNQIRCGCAHDSPIKCDSAAGSSLPVLGYIFSFGEDNRKDIFLLASSGVYRVARPSRCNYNCSLENVTAAVSPAPGPSLPRSSGILLSNQHNGLVVLVFFSFFILMYFIL